MRTIDISIEDARFEELSAVAQSAGMTPAEFARRATAAAVKSYKARHAAARDAFGYQNKPVGDEEFAIDLADLQRAGDEAW